MAKQMLADGSLTKYSLTHIVSSTGFKHQSTFNELFKRTTGVTPREFAVNAMKKITKVKRFIFVK
jgi:AraC-like DNA-binding protein